jgi:hypothetical protein
MVFAFDDPPSSSMGFWTISATGDLQDPCSSVGNTAGRPAVTWIDGAYGFVWTGEPEGALMFRTQAGTDVCTEGSRVGDVVADHCGVATTVLGAVVAWTWADPDGPARLGLATADSLEPAAFSRWELDGELGADPSSLTASSRGDLVALAWLEGEGLVRLAVASASDKRLVYGPVDLVSGAGGVAVAFAGETLGVAWTEPGTSSAVRYSRVGLEAGLPLLDDPGVQIYGVGDATAPAVAMEGIPGLFVVAFEYGASIAEIKHAIITPEGARLLAPTLTSDSSRDSTAPAVAISGRQYALAWLVDVEGVQRVAFRSYELCSSGS